MQKQIISYEKLLYIYKKSSYFMYLDANSLYGWPMSQKLPADGFKWKKMLKFNNGFIKN